MKRLWVVLLKKIMQNKGLAEKLDKPIIRKLKKRKVHSAVIDNIWGADIVDMQLLSKFNKETCFLSLCYRYSK